MASYKYLTAPFNHHVYQIKTLVILLIQFICFLVPSVTSASENINSVPVSPKTQIIRNPIFNDKMYIEQWGDSNKPAIMLIHGLGDNGARDWRYLAPVLAKSFYVITFDLPGFGRSEKNNELYSPDNYAKVIEWLSDRFIKKPFTIVGHSMGGVIALTYATNHPEQLKQLILVDTIGVLFSAAFSKNLLNNSRLSWWKQFITNTSEGENPLGFSMEDIEGVPEAIDFALSTQPTRKIFLGSDPSKIAGLAAVQKNFSGLLEKMMVPTLLVWGGKDTVAPVRIGKTLDFLLPNSRLVEIVGARHVPMLESTELFNNLIVNATNKTEFEKSNWITEHSGNNNRNEICNKQANAHYSGEYAHLDIRNCHDVIIENAKIAHLTISESSVSVTNSEIGDGNKALEIIDSMLIATATTISGNIPIQVENSRLDLSGVFITAKKQAIKTLSSYKAMFSLCKISSPEFSGYRHGVFQYTMDPH